MNKKLDRFEIRRLWSGICVVFDQIGTLVNFIFLDD